MSTNTLACEPIDAPEAAAAPMLHPDQVGVGSSAGALDSVAFFLFVLVNGILFIRPAEIIPFLEGMPFYEVLIIASVLTAAARIVPQFSPQSLLHSPITVFVLGLFIAVVLSHLSHGSIWGARTCGHEFAKVVVYYFLLVAVVNTERRLLRFLTCIAAFIVILTTLALLQYHQFINIPALAAFQEGTGQFDEWTGAPILLARLCSTGIFNDPNDLCLILLFGAMTCLYRFMSKGSGPFRSLWLLPVLLFGYALALTHSRGGFLAMLACLMVLFISRYGWQRAIPIAAAVLPLMFVLFAGRQTSINMEEGTGQDRIKIWSDSLQLLKRAPLFGVGMNQCVEEIGITSHNSFIHSYTELGLFGGTLFLGAFYVSAQSLRQLGRLHDTAVDPNLYRFHPFLLAIVVAYIAGYMTVSRSYVVPAYLVLGVVTAYLRLMSPRLEVELPRFGFRTLQHCLMASLVFLVGAYAFVRVFARFG